MTYIKICGVTNREDANAAIELGADVLGFIAVNESPRYVSARDFDRIRQVVGVDFPLVVVARRAAEAAKYHAPIVQYYESSELDDGLDDGTKRMRVIRVRDQEDIRLVMNVSDEIDAVVLDAFHTAVLGGSGARFDWSLTRSLKESATKPFILAGGLTASNVAEALSQARPYAVDVSSGVEDATPGKKNHELLRKFIESVHAWDKANGSETGEKFLQ